MGRIGAGVARAVGAGRRVALALAPLALAGCVTPTYPTHLDDAASAGPASRAAPVSASAATPSTATPTAADTAVVDAPPIQSAPAPQSVAASPLPPVSQPSTTPAPEPSAAPLASAPPSSPAQVAIPPSYTPPPAQLQAASPSPPSPAPRPPSYAPESPPDLAPATVRYRQTPGRLVAGGRVVTASGMYRDYVVQPRDHLDAIARDLQTMRKVLIEANHLESPYALQPGQHLKVPVAKAYEAQSGDTLAEVAKRFSISAAALADLNDLPQRARLRAGDKLALPDHYDDRGPTRLAAVSVPERMGSAPVSPPPRTYARAPAVPVAIATYSQPRADGGPYVPSPAAIAAARRLTVSRSYGAPSYGAGRPGPNAAIASDGYRPPPYQGFDSGALSPATAALGRGRFIWPVRGAIISGFGVQGVGRRNDGIDIRSPQGSPVRVAAAGEVVYAGDQVPGFGNLVLVKHSDGWVTAYAHLASIGVQMRQSVSQGQMLGDVGSTGSVGEAQLHFEIRYAPSPTEKARPIDPLAVLPK